MDAEDPAAVARFDRKCEGRKTSNQDWYNPDDLDAKVGGTKHGACDMLHKPEHIVDLESGAIISAEVRSGDAADTEDLANRVRGAVETLEEIVGAAFEQGLSYVESLTGDKGFHDPRELAIIHHELGLRTVIGDAHIERPERCAARVARRCSRRGASRSNEASPTCWTAAG